MPKQRQDDVHNRAEQKQHYENSVRRELNRQDNGKSYVNAMARMGLDELAEALKAFPDSIGIQHETGAPWEPTPQEVYQEQGGYLELQQQKIQVQEQQYEREQS